MKTTLLLLIASAALAQNQPQFVWEGLVDDFVVLHVRGNRADAEVRRGQPVQRQNYRFFDRLPESRQDVRLEVSQSRGRVHVVQQPRLENNYTVSVAVEDLQGGNAFYSFALFWQPDRLFDDRRPVFRPPSGGDGRERVSWAGRVDGEAVVECRAGECLARETQGQPVTRARYQFTRRLPERPVEVSLENAEGRGEVRLIEQPSERNNWAARVQIRDSFGGASDYTFTLAWNRPSHDDGRLFPERGLVWSGRVDGRVRVVAQGNAAYSEIVSGQPVYNERARFDRGLPQRNLTNLAVKRLRGRGRVEIVEFPSPGNGYRAVFEIDDSEGGADDYEVELGW